MMRISRCATVVFAAMLLGVVTDAHAQELIGSTGSGGDGGQAGSAVRDPLGNIVPETWPTDGSSGEEQDEPGAGDGGVGGGGGIGGGAEASQNGVNNPNGEFPGNSTYDATPPTVGAGGTGQSY